MILTITVTEERNRAQYTLPFRLRGAARVGSFVGRRDLLASLRAQMLTVRNQNRRGVLVLTGLGGIGKSQLAIEFAIQNQDEFTAAFWVDCHSSTTLRLSFANIAEQIPLPEILQPDGRLPAEASSIDAAVKAVKDWFEQTPNSKWLLILDNLDQHMPTSSNDHSEKGSREPDFRDYMPASSHGTVLITTRLSRFGQLGFTIEVKNMDLIDAVAIFQNCAGYSMPQDSTSLSHARVF